MKNLKFLVPLMAMLLMWTGCTEEEKEQLKPDVEIGNVTFNEDYTKAYIEVTPSVTALSWYWKNVEKDGEDVEYTKVSGNESCKLEIPVSPAKTYTFSVYAENVAGTSEIRTREFTTDASQATDVEFSMNIKNVSPYTLDVEVVKGSSCEKYVIAMLPVTTYKEEQFIESSMTSLNPNPSYPLQPYNWSDKDTTFNEQTLSKDNLATSEESKGVKVNPGEKYYIAAYLIDKDGNDSVVKEEILMPAATVDYVTAGLDVAIDIKDEDITNTSVKATFTAPAECKKILVTVMPGSTTYDELTTDEEKNDFIALVGNGVNVRSYTEPFDYQFKTILDYGTEYMVCAIPFNEEGKMGNIACKKFSSKKPELNGTGTIQSANVTLAENGNIKVSMTPSSNVETVRVYYDTEKDYNAVAKDMDMVMADDINEFMRTDYTVAQVEAGIELYVNHPGDNYYVIVSTIDTDGNISKPQNIVSISNVGDEYIQTKDPEEQTVSFDGTGQATLTVQETSNDGSIVEGNYKVVKGEGAVKVFRVLKAGEFPENVETVAQNAITEDNMTELTFNENNEYEGTFEYWEVPSGQWGGQLLIIVTLDANNKYKITSYYSAGSQNAVNY